MSFIFLLKPGQSFTLVIIAEPELVKAEEAGLEIPQRYVKNRYERSLFFISRTIRDKPGSSA
jgi:hypothetical protein